MHEQRGYRRGSDEKNTIHVRVASDWVEDNFYAPALAIVQKIAFDQRKKFVDKTGIGNKTMTGCISVPSFKINDDQICQIKYDGKNNTWRGCVRLPTEVGKPEKYKFVFLKEEWVFQNVDKSVFNMAKAAGKKGFQKKFYLPEGDNKDHTGTFHHSMAPIIYYRQKTGDRTCLLNATASAIHYLKERKLSNKIFKKTIHNDYLLNGFAHIRDTILEEAKLVGGYQLMACKKGFDVLSNSKDYWLCVVGLHGSDGKMDHAVAIANGWIFDSNFEKALKLTKENLDLCCSSDDVHSSFAKITKGWLVSRNISKKGKTTRSKAR